MRQWEKHATEQEDNEYTTKLWIDIGLMTIVIVTIAVWIISLWNDIQTITNGSN